LQLQFCAMIDVAKRSAKPGAQSGGTPFIED
jgi:hypothetical protein